MEKHYFNETFKKLAFKWNKSLHTNHPFGQTCFINSPAFFFELKYFNDSPKDIMLFYLKTVQMHIKLIRTFIFNTLSNVHTLSN